MPVHHRFIIHTRRNVLSPRIVLSRAERAPIPIMTANQQAAAEPESVLHDGSNRGPKGDTWQIAEKASFWWGAYTSVCTSHVCHPPCFYSSIRVLHSFAVLRREIIWTSGLQHSTFNREVRNHCYLQRSHDDAHIVTCRLQIAELSEAAHNDLGSPDKLSKSGGSTE